MSSSKKMVRQKFREAVFKRDGHTCLFCSIKTSLDAHHIINRNLMPDGGYVLSNGATLCPTHHLGAESGAISVAQIRKMIADRA
jgi:5-methylcytosine-specific restriction endonuclease McrA